MSEHVRSIMRSQKKDKRIGKPFVTVSYEVGAYGLSVVGSLFEYLQKYEKRKEYTWKVFDKNLAKKVTEDHNLSSSVLPYFSESTVSEIEDGLEFLVGLHPTRLTLVYEMNKTILHLAESGYVIIVGRGSNIITGKLSKGVHVRLIGSFENRVQYLKQYLKIEEKEARRFIPQEDRRRANYFKKYFDRDINDSLLYDLIINTDRLSIQDIVKEIGSLVIKREWENNNENRK